MRKDNLYTVHTVSSIPNISHSRLAEVQRFQMNFSVCTLTHGVSGTRPTTPITPGDQVPTGLTHAVSDLTCCSVLQNTCTRASSQLSCCVLQCAISLFVIILNEETKQLAKLVRDTKSHLSVSTNNNNNHILHHLHYHHHHHHYYM